MNVYWWFMLGIGIAGYLFGWRYVTQRVIWSMNREPDAGELYFLPLVFLVVWPMVVVTVGLSKLANKTNPIRQLFIKHIFPNPYQGEVTK